jgi:predicted ATPase
LSFSEGINVFIGENGSGKTHIMKALYSACQASRQSVTGLGFAAKLVRVFHPEGLSLHRLVRRGHGNKSACIRVATEKNALTISFDAKHKSGGMVSGGEGWKREFETQYSTFIPAKEILSHSRNLIQAIDQGNVDFDDTYRDLISAASINVKTGKESDQTKRYLAKLRKIAQGRVKIQDDVFYLVDSQNNQLEFALVAEGLRKVALLWQLIKNGTLQQGAVLFWDEPEANINPKHIPAIVDILLQLENDGVQIFLGTHDFFLAKYLDVRKNSIHRLKFHALYHSSEKDDNGAIRVECSEGFSQIENNSILRQSIELYKEEVEKVLK